MSDTITTLNILDGEGAPQTVLATVNTAGNLTPLAVIALEGTPISTGTPLPVADAAAEAALGNPADAIYGGSGAGSMISLLKGILATNAPPTGGATAVLQGQQLAQETATATGVGSPSDTAWTSGNGSLVALLKATVAAINAQGADGGATATNQVSQIALESAISAGTGSPSDTAWSGTGSGTQVAILKAISGALTGTLPVSDATTHTTLTSILAALGATLAVSDSGTHTAIGATNTAIAATNTAIGATNTALAGTLTTSDSGTHSALAGTLNVSDATSHTSLATVVTETTATAVGIGTPADTTWSGTGSGSAIAILKKIATGSTGAVTTGADQVSGTAATTGLFAVGGVAAASGPTFTAGDAYPLSLTTGGALRVSDTVLETAITTQAATPGTGLIEVGGIFNTTLPTLTTGQASKIQLDASGRLILGTSAAVIGSLAAGANLIGSVNIDVGGTPVSASAPMPISATAAANSATNPLFAGLSVSGAAVTGAAPLPITLVSATPTLNTSDATSHTTLASILTQDTASATALGTPADTVWGGTGSGSAIAILKAIVAASGGTGGATAANQATQITQETASATALGTPADVAWTTGSGSTIALLKAIATDISGTLTVTDVNLDHTYAAGQATAPTGELIVGGIYNVATPTLTTGQVAQLQLNANGYLRINDVLLDNAVAAQGAAPGASNVIMAGGLFNTTPPTLTSGQAGRLQIDATGGLILGASTKSIGTVVLGAGAAAVGSVTVTTSALPTGAATSAIQATQQTSLTAIQAAYVTKGSAGAPASLVGIGAEALAALPSFTTATTNSLNMDTSGQLYVTDLTSHTTLSSILTQDTASATALGTPADTAWTTGSGSVVALLKTIASSAPAGGATAANQTSQITQETAIATATGTISDTAWVSGNGTVIALLKKIAAGGGGGGGGAVTTVADTVSGATTGTGLFTVGGAALTGNPTLTSGDSYPLSLTTAGGLRTADINVAGTIVAQAATAPASLQVAGGVFTTALPTLTSGQAGHLQLTASGLLMTADQGAASTIGTQAGTAPTGVQMVGGVFTTALPTLTTGQSGHLQLDTNGRVIIANGSGGVLTVSATTASNTAANTIFVSPVVGGAAVSATAPLPISATAAANTVSNPLFAALSVAGAAVTAAAAVPMKEFKGQGGMVVVPAGSTNGTAIGTLPAGSNGVRIYLKPTDGVTFTIQTTAPSSAPTATMAISGNITGPNWDEPLVGTAMIYVTVLTGTPTFRFM